MPRKVSGVNDQSILQHKERGEMDRYGVDMITRVEMVPVGKFPELLKAEGAAHPRYTSMAVSRRSFQLVKAGAFYEVTYLFEGFLLNLPAKVYELNGSLIEEPIQTHKDFESELAGTPASAKNGAVFIDPETGQPSSEDSKGIFERFGRGALHGVDAYRSPTAIWTEISFSQTRPSDLGDLGKIDEPSGSEPNFGSGRNWQYVGASYRKRGHIYEIRKTWEVSGRGGWNPLLY